ncbi:MAG: hypothetical protein JXR75_07955 [Rhodobacteraceae bacterium]|nr:hypothetical protein [Paracoccaceae bacterium]
MLVPHLNVRALLWRFKTCEGGAVTVDWVVLTAAVVGLALSVWLIVVDSLFIDGGVAIAVDITEAARRP